MRGLNGKGESVFYSLLIVLMFAGMIFQALAKEGIYITGINPQSASAGDHVTVYGGGATPGALVRANLTGPFPRFVSGEYLGNSSIGYAGPGNNSYTVLPFGNFSIEFHEQSLGNNTVVYGNFGNYTVGIIFAQVGTVLGQTYAGEDGGWRIDFVAPQFFPGNYTVTVLDNETLMSDSVDLQILGSSYIGSYPWPILPTNSSIGFLNVTVSIPFTIDNVSPLTGPPGTWVTVSGRGASGRIRISFGGNQVAYTDVSFYDSWSVAFQVPYLSLGTYSIAVTDEPSGRVAFKQFAVTPVSTPVIPNLANMLLTGSVLIYIAGLAAGSGVATFMLIAVAERIRRRRCSSYGSL